jgi:uncharacterized protein (DUF433 family)
VIASSSIKNRTTVIGLIPRDTYIDWTRCELVEQIRGKVSGRPVVRGSRILADSMVQDAELGSWLEEIRENYSICR